MLQPHEERVSRAHALSRVLLVVLLAYGCWHLFWYWQTPLGQSPVLDERENLELARQIIEGRLPAEPFYRSMLYPLVLAPLAAALPDAWLPFAATLVGLVMHIFAAVLAAGIARRWSGSTPAGALVLLLYGLNPVLLHYATQILDATLANLLLLLGLQALDRARDAERAGGALAGANVAWALAALARPQLFVLWILFVPISAIYLGLGRRHVALPWRALVRSVGIGVLLFVAQGLVQAQLSGSFRIMPTQGAYNLWAANRPGANGRYFTQSIYLPTAHQHENPTRRESLVLFQQATGATQDDLDAANAYWRQRLREVVREDFAGVLSVQGRKLYYLLNHQEQYNNKTYSFHRARSPALRFNPLGWGPLLLLGALGALALASRPESRPLVLGVLLLLLVLAAATLTGYASGRFRLPLVAVLTCLSGGLVALPGAVRQASPRQRLLAGLLLAALAGLTFSRFLGAADRSTYLQDHLLLAAAAERVGDDTTAWQEAGRALQLAPTRPDALALRLTSYFNRLLSEGAAAADEVEWVTAARRHLALPPSLRRPSLDLIAALALWRQGAEPEAAALLRRLRHQEAAASEALGALVLTGLATETERADLLQSGPGPSAGALERLARAVHAPGGAQPLQAMAARLTQRPAAPPPRGVPPVAENPAAAPSDP